MKPSTGTGYSFRAEFGRRFRGKRVLVTGGRGFIGSHVSRVLHDLGAEVHVISRYGSPLPISEGVRVWRGDLRFLDPVKRVLGKVRAQWVIHLAGKVSGRRDVSLVLPTLENGLVGTVNLLLACRGAGCRRVVLAGSSEEPRSWDDPPRSPYSAAKGAEFLYGRMFHEVFETPVVFVRSFFAFGPGQEDSKLIPYSIRMLMEKKPPRIESGNRVCDFIFVSDVVRGILLAVLKEDPSGEVFDLGLGQPVTIREVVEILVELTGSSVRPVFLSPEGCSGEPRTADLRGTERAIGWHPIWSLREGLSETIRWYRGEQEGGRHRGVG